VYHCLPSELDNESWDDVALHLEFMNQEARVDKMKDKGGGQGDLWRELTP